MNKIGYILISLLGLWLCFLCGRRSAERGQENQQIKEIIKIVKVIDTVEIPEPIPYLVENTDTMYIDVIKFADEPLKVPLIKQRVTYTDSTYKAVVSGYNPKLEYIETYNITHYITEEVREKPKKWGLGVSAGYAISELGWHPYIGVGISYNFIRF